MPVTQSRRIKRLFEGRIGRSRYFEGSFFASLPLFLLVIFWGIIRLIQDAAGSTSQDLTSLIFAGDLISRLIPILIAPAVILFFVLHIALAIRRLHDMGNSGWWYLLTWIPYLGIVAALVILFKKGQIEQNEYGHPPATGRKFLAEIFNY